jgi:hypothetical protein
MSDYIIFGHKSPTNSYYTGRDSQPHNPAMLVALLFYANLRN